jgi:hypothetical protein
MNVTQRATAVVPAVAIGALLYVGLYAYVESLTHRFGEANPFYKVAVADAAEDHLIILGASRALPLTFGPMHDRLESLVAGPVLNLAMPGSGVIPNVVLTEYLLERLGPERVRAFVYALDSFAFYSSEWNEARLDDTRLWQRAPLDPALARTLWAAGSHHGVARSVPWSYVSGITKINDPTSWYLPDRWDDEARFDMTYRPDSWLDERRIEFLYPAGTDLEAFERYLGVFLSFLDRLQELDIPVMVVKLPLRAAILDAIPGEEAFDARLAMALGDREVPLFDFSTLNFTSEHFYDPDHLNLAGATRFSDEHLAPVLREHAR